MIDHIFMFIDPEGPEIGQMKRLGLAETYWRTHQGQGTRNVCYCFDNMFLELLWVDDPMPLEARLSRERGFTSDPYGEAVRSAPLESRGGER